ncbi:MAG: hypothetical protein KGH61_05525, partial [Candidatus Micrarchaeota archaeon]|nr:hypothetical protein [Candidatus Micrarchaeota archaeon]
INLLYFDSLILLVMVVSLDQKSNRRCKILRFTLVSEDFYKTLFRQDYKSYDCGPACAKMMLSYYGIERSIAQIKKRVRVHGKIGTFSPQLGSFFIKNGFDVQIVTFNPFIFTNRDRKGLSKVQLIKRFSELRKKLDKRDNKLACKYYIEYLRLGGRIRIRIPSKSDIEGEIRAGRPTIVPLTSKFLRWHKPRFNSHFNVVTGIDRKMIYVNDPVADSSGGRKTHNADDFMFGIYANAFGAADNCSIIKIRRSYP